MHERIPRRIIQTGKRGCQGILNRAVVANLRLLNPGYEYLFFDDDAVEAFIKREFPQYESVFHAFQIPIERYDFFRYLAVYSYGGFYFDFDVLLASGVSDLLHAGCVFPFEGLTISRYLREHGMDWEIGNYAFGAAPCHPFVKQIIENCVRAQQDPGWVKPMLRGYPALLRAEYRVLNTTGPGLISRTLLENPTLADDVTVLFPDDICDERAWNLFGEYGVHMMEGSWRFVGGNMRRRVAYRWEQWRTDKGIVQSRKLGKSRQYKPAMGTIDPPRHHAAEYSGETL